MINAGLREGPNRGAGVAKTGYGHTHNMINAGAPGPRVGYVLSKPTCGLFCLQALLSAGNDMACPVQPFPRSHDQLTFVDLVAAALQALLGLLACLLALGLWWGV